MVRKILIAGFVLNLLLVTQAMAADIYVPRDYPTIQGAIDVAVNGDTVLVADGTYNITSTIDFGNRAITLKSEHGPASTILTSVLPPTSSPLNDLIVIRTPSTFEGFTIKEAQPEYDVLLVLNSATIRNNVFQFGENARSEAIRIVDPLSNGPILIENNILTKSYNGIEIDKRSGTTTIQNNLITESVGAGIMINNGQGIVINNNTIYHNGIGVLFTGLGQGINIIKNSIIYGNTTHQLTCGIPSLRLFFVSYSDVQGSSSDTEMYCGHWYSVTNIDKDPRFINASDFHLGDHSPCIDAAEGNPSLPVDLDFKNRYDDRFVANTGAGVPNYVDMGALERQTDSTPVRTPIGRQPPVVVQE